MLLRNNLINVKITLKVNRLDLDPPFATPGPQHLKAFGLPFNLFLLVADASDDTFHLELGLRVEHWLVESEFVVLVDRPYLFAGARLFVGDVDVEVD